MLCISSFFSIRVWLMTGKSVAVKVLESVHEVIEEIEEEYLILRDHGRHPNLPSFFGIFMHKSPRSDDQLWIAMEVSCVRLDNYLGLLLRPR